jgi:hypothetical protein
MAAGRLTGPIGINDWNPRPQDEHKRPVDLINSRWPLNSHIGAPLPGLHHFASPLRHDPVAAKGGHSWHAAPAQASARRHAAAAADLDFDKLYQDIQRWEGVILHMYLDTHDPPLVTVGTGNMLPTVAAAQALPFVNASTHKPATKEEIAAAYHAIAAMKGGMPARRYRRTPSIELTTQKSKELAISRLTSEFIPGIRKMLPGFDSYPLPAREALIDIAYNAGVGDDARVVHGKRHKASGLHAFRHLREAVTAGDWLAAAGACHRSSSRPDRNAWTRALFEEAARTAGQTARAAR